MPDERSLTLRQADQARTEFAALEIHLESLMAQMAQPPTYKELATMAPVDSVPEASRSRRDEEFS